MDITPEQKEELKSEIIKVKNIIKETFKNDPEGQYNMLKTLYEGLALVGEAGSTGIRGKFT